MVELTKKKRYTKEIIRGLLENRAFLSALDFMHAPTDMTPIIDFDIALKNADLTDTERLIIDTVYTDKVSEYNESIPYWADNIDVTERHIRRLRDSIIDKVHAEINRGLAND